MSGVTSNTVQLQAANGQRIVAETVRREHPDVLVLQEVFGVNSHIRAVTDGFAADGFLAIAPALFDRVERGVDIGYAGADLERGRALKAQATDDNALLDIRAAMAHVASAGPVAVIGYCWGGTLAWLAACEVAGLSAAVSYYGSGVAALASLSPKCPVQAHFGDKDASIPPSAIETVRKAHPEVDVHIYPAGHGFNCDQRSAFDAPSAKLARERTLQFLQANGLPAR